MGCRPRTTVAAIGPAKRYVLTKRGFMRMVWSALGIDTQPVRRLLPVQQMSHPVDVAKASGSAAGLRAAWPDDPQPRIVEGYTEPSRCLCGTSSRIWTSWLPWPLPGFTVAPVSPANRAMTVLTSLGPSADCRGLTHIPRYQVRTSPPGGPLFGFAAWLLAGLGFTGKVARTSHQRTGSGLTVYLQPLRRSHRHPRQDARSRVPGLPHPSARMHSRSTRRLRGKLREALTCSLQRSPPLLCRLRARASVAA